MVKARIFFLYSYFFMSQTIILFCSIFLYFFFPFSECLSFVPSRVGISGERGCIPGGSVEGRQSVDRSIKQFIYHRVLMSPSGRRGAAIASVGDTYLRYNRRRDGSCQERVEIKPYEPLVVLDVLRPTLKAPVAFGKVGGQELLDQALGVLVHEPGKG